jgi:cell division protein FtsB
MNSRLWQYFLIVLGLVLIGNTVVAIVDFWRAGGQVSRREKEVVKQRLENEKLQSKLREAQSPQYLERIARDKLNLTKPGEYVVILPKPEATSSASQFIDSRPNWIKWREIIF